MIQGHLDQQRTNLQSTQTNSTTRTPTTVTESQPHLIQDTATDSMIPAPLRTHTIFADCHLMTGKIATNMTGRFLVSSSWGNSYMLVVYDYDSNYIHAEPLRSCSGTDILAAYKSSIALLTSRGLTPRLQRLDNEASQALQQFLTDESIDYQLAPPHVHRRNSAERAIRTFKNHFIAGLSGTDPDFPLHLWDWLLPQAVHTSNLLRASSRINPRLSAQAQHHGVFEFNRMPLAPAGTRVMIHEKSSVWGTWAPHAVHGWYLGPAMHHYWCYKVYLKETAAERIADTFAWFPRHVSIPVQSSVDAATAAAQALIHALLHPAHATPIATINDQQRDALTQLAHIFANETSPCPSPQVLPLHIPANHAARLARVATPLTHAQQLPPLPAAPMPLAPGPPPLPLLAPPTVFPAPSTLTPTDYPAPTTAAPCSRVAPTIPAVPSSLAPPTYATVTGNATHPRRRIAAKAQLTPVVSPPRHLPTMRHHASKRCSQRPTPGTTHFAAMCLAFATNNSPLPTTAPPCEPH